VHGKIELVCYNGVWFSRDSSPLKHAACEKEERRTHTFWLVSAARAAVITILQSPGLKENSFAFLFIASATGAKFA
jgi:hypothetical protein